MLQDKKIPLTHHWTQFWYSPIPWHCLFLENFLLDILALWGWKGVSPLIHSKLWHTCTVGDPHHSQGTVKFQSVWWQPTHCCVHTVNTPAKHFSVLSTTSLNLVSNCYTNQRLKLAVTYLLISWFFLDSSCHMWCPWCSASNFHAIVTLVTLSNSKHSHETQIPQNQQNAYHYMLFLYWIVHFSHNEGH